MPATSPEWTADVAHAVFALTRPPGGLTPRGPARVRPEDSRDCTRRLADLHSLQGGCVVSPPGPGTRGVSAALLRASRHSTGSTATSAADSLWTTRSRLGSGRLARYRNARKAEADARTALTLVGPRDKRSLRLVGPLSRSYRVRSASSASRTTLRGVAFDALARVGGVPMTAIGIHASHEQIAPSALLTRDARGGGRGLRARLVLGPLLALERAPGRVGLRLVVARRRDAGDRACRSASSTRPGSATTRRSWRRRPPRWPSCSRAGCPSRSAPASSATSTSPASRGRARRRAMPGCASAWT